MITCPCSNCGQSIYVSERKPSFWIKKITYKYSPGFIYRYWGSAMVELMQEDVKACSFWNFTFDIFDKIDVHHVQAHTKDAIALSVSLNWDGDK